MKANVDNGARLFKERCEDHRNVFSNMENDREFLGLIDVISEKIILSLKT